MTLSVAPICEHMRIVIYSTASICNGHIHDVSATNDKAKKKWRKCLWENNFGCDPIETMERERKKCKQTRNVLKLKIISFESHVSIKRARKTMKTTETIFTIIISTKFHLRFVDFVIICIPLSLPLSAFLGCVMRCRLSINKRTNEIDWTRRRNRIHFASWEFSCHSIAYRSMWKTSTIWKILQSHLALNFSMTFQSINMRLYHLTHCLLSHRK